MSGGRGLEIYQQKSCRNEKSTKTKKSTTKKCCENRQGRRDGSVKLAMLRSRARTHGRDTRRVVAQISDTSPLDHPVLETPNVRERDEQERAKGRQGTTKRGSGGRGAAGQYDRPPDATARIRAHGNGESRERRVRFRCKQRDNAGHGSQQKKHTERRERKPGSGDQFKEHPEGKKPDAMFRMLAFRLAALVEKQNKDLDGAVGALKEQYQETAKRALQTVLITGMQAEKDKDMRNKRCFDVNYKDGQKQCIRWILAAPVHPEFMHALNVLKQTRILEAVQIKVEEDRATMSKAAKDIWDALKAGGSGGGSSSGPAERSEQGDEHSKSSAVHQDKMRGGIPWFEFSEENLSMARCGALRGVARLGPGRCKLGISHYLQSPICPSGTCKQSAVGGTLVQMWVVAAACTSRIVQLSSVLHVGPISEAPMFLLPLKSFTHSFKLVGMSLCCDVFFPGTGDRRPLS